MMDMEFGTNAGALQFVQPPPQRKPHHRRVPSDPFEFDEPLEPQYSSPMFSELKCPHDGFSGSIYFDDDDTAMTVVDDSLTSGSESDDCAAMVEDFGLLGAADTNSECNSAQQSMPRVKHEGPADDSLWNDVDAWMLGVDTAPEQNPAGSWLNSGESGPFDLVPVSGGPDRSSSHESSAGITPSALPIMSPCSNAPSPAPASTGHEAFSVGEKRSRFSSTASPQHRLLKINRHGDASSGMTAVPEQAQQLAPALSPAATECEPPPLLQKPLPAEVAARMLNDDSYDPGARPIIFNAAAGQWLFKERSRGRTNPNARSAMNDRSNDRADRWHNSGGVRGARDMPKNGVPLVRRRYGSVAQNGEILWRFHEYSALKVVADPAAPDGQRVDEDRSTVVFHVMPKRSGKGRPSKAEAELPAQMWKTFGFENL